MERLAPSRGLRGLSITTFVLNNVRGRNLSAAGNSFKAKFAFRRTPNISLRFINMDKDWEFGLLLFREQEMGRK